MATINQVEKIDYSAQKIDYTSKDYVAILDDLINSIIWNTSLTSEASTKRPLSKMTIDIINQVKEYVYEV